MSSRDEDSVSFEIPSNADSSNLLEDVGYEFFGTTDDFMNTPMPPNKSRPTLIALDIPKSNNLVSNTRLPLPQNPPAIVTTHSKTAKLAPPRTSLVGFDIPNSNCLVGNTRFPLPQNTPSIVAPHTNVAKLASRGKNKKTISEDAENIPVAVIDPSPPPPSPCGKLQQPSGVIIGVTNQNPLRHSRSSQSIELPPSPEHIRCNVKGKSRPTVMNGGINKFPKRTAHKLSNLRSISETRHPVQESHPISSSNNEKATLASMPPNSSLSFNGEEMAQQLVAQKLDSTTDRRTNEDILIEPRMLTVPENPAQSVIEHIDDDRLTVSKLSPLKTDEGPPSAIVAAPISPMRPSKKRSLITAKDYEGIVHDSIKDAIGDRNREQQQSKSSRRKNNVPSASSNLLAKRLKAKTAPLKQSPIVDKGKAKTGLKASAPQSRIGLLETSQADKDGSDIGRKLHTSHPIPPGKHPRSLSNSNSTLHPLPKLTMPTGFRFELDVRMEARKTELEQKTRSEWKRPKMHHGTGVIPGFTQSHAAKSASSSIRKEQRVPVVPVGFSFSTESRAKEREKFDEQMRVKQQEHERQLEEQRRQKEVEEERAVKELRKRAIPRANEVPEWYVRMPKRRENNEGA